MTVRKNTKSSLKHSSPSWAPPLPPSPVPRPSSDLWDLVVDRNWESVLRHVTHSPQDAAWFDGHYRESVLYLVMQSSPPNADVVQAIVDAHPDSVMGKCTKNHDLPIHIACRYQLSANILNVIINTNVESTLAQTRWGNTPLVALWEYRVKAQKRRIAQIRIQQQQEQERRRQQQQEEGRQGEGGRGEEERQARLHQQRQQVNDGRDEDNTEQQDNEENEEHNQVTHDGSSGSRPPDSNRFSEIHHDDTFWEKVNILLEGVARYHNLQVESDCFGQGSSFNSRSLSSSTSHPKYLILHAATSLGSMGCPYPVFERVLSENAHQAQQVDRMGRLPLHLAVGPSRWTQSGSGGQRKYRPREGHIIAALLKVYPDAARIKIRLSAEPTNESATVTHIQKLRRDQYRPTYHRILPLHYALTNRHRWSDGIREILVAYPQALTIRDECTKLYPFQSAAMIPRRSSGTAVDNDTPGKERSTALDTDAVDLETIFQLLRADPNVIDLLMENQSMSSSCSNKYHEALRSVGMTNFTAQCLQKISFGVSETSVCSPALTETLLGCAAAILIGMFAGRFLG